MPFFTFRTSVQEHFKSIVEFEMCRKGYDVGWLIFHSIYIKFYENYDGRAEHRPSVRSGARPDVGV